MIMNGMHGYRLRFVAFLLSRHSPLVTLSRFPQIADCLLQPLRIPTFTPPTFHPIQLPRFIARWLDAGPRPRPRPPVHYNTYQHVHTTAVTRPCLRSGSQARGAPPGPRPARARTMPCHDSWNATVRPPIFSSIVSTVMSIRSRHAVPCSPSSPWDLSYGQAHYHHVHYHQATRESDCTPTLCRGTRVEVCMLSVCRRLRLVRPHTSCSTA